MITFQPRFPEAPSSAQALFAYLLQNGAASRVELSRETGLARPTISEATERLFDAGLLKVLDKDAGATGKRGRIPDLYDIADDIGTILTWRDLGLRLELTSYNLRKQQLAQATLDVSWSNDELVKEVVNRLIAEVKSSFTGPVLASAVSIVLPVNPESQQIVEFEAPHRDGHLVDLHALVAHATQAPVMVDNHVNWGLYSEYFEGVAQDYQSVSAFSFGKDMGAAFADRGRIIRGSTGRAGELSRLVVGEKRFKDIINEVAVHSEEMGLSGFTYLDAQKTAQRITSEPDSPAIQQFLAAFGRISANQLMMSDVEALVLTGPMVDVPGFAAQLAEATQALLPWKIDILVAQDGAGSTQRGIILGAQRLALKSLGLGALEED